MRTMIVGGKDEENNAQNQLRVERACQDLVQPRGGTVMEGGQTRPWKGCIDALWTVDGGGRGREE